MIWTTRLKQLATISPYIGLALICVGLFLGYEADYRRHAVALICLAFAIISLVQFSDSEPWARDLGRFCLLTSFTLTVLFISALFQSLIGLAITAVFLGLFVATSLSIAWRNTGTDEDRLHSAFTLLGLLTNIVLLVISFVALVQLLIG